MDIISFIQDRISQVYTEQMWTITILGIYYGFIIKNRETIKEFIKDNIKPVFVQIAIWAPFGIGFFFVLSRHFIFRYYNGYLKQEWEKEGHKILSELSTIENIGQIIVNWSGVVIYSLLILVLALFTFIALKNKKTGNIKKDS